MTEKHHATHGLLAPATPTPPPCTGGGASAQPRPVVDRRVRERHTPMNTTSTHILAGACAQPEQSLSPPDQ